MRPIRGTLIAILIVAGAAASWLVWRGAAGGAGRGGARGGAGALPVPVEVAPVESDLLRETRVLSGTLEASSQFVVAAKIAGRVEHLDVDLGDPSSATS